MAEIKAFVGHSFTPEDADVVQAFLDYFDQVRGVVPAFSWTHATQSEPIDLKEKVLRNIENANTLIAICTRKERVAHPAEFRAAHFKKHIEQIATSKLEWKTSDWVIQEIGLGIGRGMAILILLEEGVRAPGGLQGNIEYLPFNRDNPHKIFGKLLEMITALAPQTSSTGTASYDDVANTDKQGLIVIPEMEPISHTAMPSAEWGVEDYRQSALDALIWGEEIHAETISSKFLETNFAQDRNIKDNWLANFEWWKIIFTSKGSLARLKQLATESPTDVSVLRFYGTALVHYGEQAEGAAHLVRAAELESDKEKCVIYYCDAAEALATSHDFDGADHILDKVREISPQTVAAKNRILRALHKLSELQGSLGSKLSALEGLVEIAPGDEDLRFSLAYEHSLAGNRDMALHHYLKIPASERSSMAWNNLGVAYQDFDMPRMAVIAYEKSASFGETLAMSNLANKLLQAGFVDEAQKQLDKAIALPNFHKNVSISLTQLRSQVETEAKIQSDLINEVAPKAAFYRLSGQALAEPNVSPSGKWISPLCALNVTTDGVQFTASGTYENKGINALGYGAGSGSLQQFTIRYTGRLSGRSICGEVTRTRTTPPPIPSLLSGTNSEKFCAVVAEDGRSISVMERVEARNPTSYEIQRVDQLLVS